MNNKPVGYKTKKVPEGKKGWDGRVKWFNYNQLDEEQPTGCCGVKLNIKYI